MSCGSTARMPLCRVPFSFCAMAKRPRTQRPTRPDAAEPLLLLPRGGPMHLLRLLQLLEPGGAVVGREEDRDAQARLLQPGREHGFRPQGPGKRVRVQIYPR